MGSVSASSVGGTAVGDGLVAVADNTVGVGGAVGVTVGGGLVGAKPVIIGVGSTAVGNEVGVAADPQAATRAAARMSTII